MEKFKYIVLIMGLLSIFGCVGKSKKNSSVVAYAEMTEEQKNKYRVELKREDGKDFGSEFIRTTDLEKKLISKYGFDAVKLIFEYRNSSNYHELGKFPGDCPWVSLNDKTLTEFIEVNFKLIKDKIPDLIKSLKERCRFIYAEKKDSTWDLHYLLDMKLHDSREYYLVYTGGVPNSTPVANSNLKSFNWSIPFDLAEFYSIHDGFGQVYDADFILSSKDITVMGEMMNPICQKDNNCPEEYKFDDLLEFFPDGAGNAQCFYRNERAHSNNLTVDWDHEVWEISAETGFYEFINQRMRGIDEE